MQPSETESKEAVNGFHANGSVLDGDSLDSLSEQLDTASLDAAELDSEPATSDITGIVMECSQWLYFIHQTTFGLLRQYKIFHNPPCS